MAVVTSTWILFGVEPPAPPPVPPPGSGGQPPPLAPPPQPRRGFPWVWLLVGCGCLLVLMVIGGAVGILWYAGKGAGEEPFQIGLATSADGVELERHGPPVVEVGQRGDFDARGLLHPAVAWDGSLRLFRMWYVGVDFFGQTSVGYAVSVDGVTWKKAPGGAVLDARALGLTRLGGTEVWLDPVGRLRLWLDGATLDEPRRRIFELKNDGALAP